MKVKQILVSLVSILAVGACAIGLTACGDMGELFESISSSEENEVDIESNDGLNQHEHDWNQLIVKQAECETTGSVLYSCYCGEDYTVEIPALGHTMKAYEGKEPTCAEIGWKAYESCQRDGCGYSTYVEIAITPDEHHYEQGNCVYCEDEQTKGLSYYLSNDGMYYTVYYGVEISQV